MIAQTQSTLQGVILSIILMYLVVLFAVGHFYLKPHACTLLRLTEPILFQRIRLHEAHRPFGVQSIHLTDIDRGNTVRIDIAD